MSAKTPKGLFRLTIITLLWLLAMALPVWAEGDGSGGGQNVPLGLASSTPANGTQNVALDARIKLVFNKNVINMTVSENNQRCFSLYAGNAAVPIEVQMADDQIYPELKRDVTLVPRQVLKSGTDYTVVISRALQAKNGALLGKDVKIKFRTVAAPANSNPAAGVEGKTVTPTPPAANQDNGSQPESKAVTDNGEKEALSADTAKPEVKPESNSKTGAETDIKPVPSGKTASDQTSKKTPGIWLAAVLGVLIAAGVGYWLVRRTR